jgi:nucleoside-diphosphate-sugar epimerase
MPGQAFDVVTGAFGFTGRHITQRLLTAGRSVVTLTGHPDRLSPFGDRVRALPFSFDDPAALRERLQGARTLYNTYWIRFAHGTLTFEQAVRNTATLITAAREADVGRFVHVSIANPADAPQLPYYAGKTRVEELLRVSGLSHAILRPTVLFGDQGLLINNIAWMLRRFPCFVLPGGGEYGIQPVSVDDLADMAIAAGSDDADSVTDAVGPEVYAFRDLVRLLARSVHSRAVIVRLPAALSLLMSRLIGSLVGDVVLTRDELAGLAANLLVSKGPPTCPGHLSHWLREYADRVGRRYVSEVKWHFGSEKQGINDARQVEDDTDWRTAW